MISNIIYETLGNQIQIAAIVNSLASTSTGPIMMDWSTSFMIKIVEMGLDSGIGFV